VFLVVLVVLLVVVWGGLRRGDPDEPGSTSRRIDKQFEKPPNEGGLLQIGMTAGIVRTPRRERRLQTRKRREAIL